jgi:hypothetical protein
MRDWDAADVFRKAHELTQSHGRNAAAYAARLATLALVENEKPEAEFWRAVELSLLPRDENKANNLSQNS